MDLNTHKTTDPYTQQALTHIHISYLPQIKAWTQTHTWYQVLKSWTQTNTKIQGCVRYGTGILGTGMDVPNLSKFPVPVLMSYRTYRSVRYRYWCCTELTEVSGTGIDVVPNLPKCPVPVLKSVPVPAVPVSMSYRTYRSVRYRY